MIPGIVSAQSRAAGVVFTAGTPVETEFATATSPWDLTVTFATDDNAVFVDFSWESADTVSSVVLDPAGINQALTLIRTATNSVTQVFSYGAWGLSGLSGSKTLRITQSAAVTGSAVHCTFKGAANAAPTPTDSDASASATTLASSLASPNAGGVVHFVGQANTNTGVTIAGVTETARRTDSSAFYTIVMGRKVGSLTNPEAPSISQPSNNRLVCCSYVVNPA